LGTLFQIIGYLNRSSLGHLNFSFVARRPYLIAETERVTTLVDGTAPRDQIRSVPEFPYGDDNNVW
jgi:hypothetical protein